MKVGVVGAGVMGTALGRAVLRAGHEVVVGSRRVLSPRDGLVFGAYADAARFGDLVVLATVWDETARAVAQSGSLRDRILIDATNPEDGEGRSRPLADGASGGEHVARWAQGARVVKASNHVYAPLLDAGPVLSGQKASVFYCGDDRDGKAQVGALIEELGSAAREVFVAERAQADAVLAGRSLADQLDLARYVARRDADPQWTFREHLRRLQAAIEV